MLRCKALLAIAILLTSGALISGHAQAGAAVQGQAPQSPEDELADVLLAAQSDDQRLAILAGRPELVNTSLWQALNGRAGREFNQGNYGRATTILDLMHRIAEKINNKELSARTLNNIGLVQNWQGDLPQALKYFQESLALGQAAGSKAVAAIALANLGMVYSQMGDLARSLECSERSLAINQELGAKQKIAGTLTNIGILYHQQGDFEQALNYYRKGLAIDEETGDKMDAASDYEDMGILFRQQGNPDQALEYHRKALATYESLGAKSHIALSLSHIADAYRVQGDYSRALDYYDRSLKIGEDEKTLVATVLNNRALVYLSQGNYSQVLVDSGRAGEIALEIGKQDSVLTAYENQGRAYRGLREFQHARKAFDDAITVAEQMRLEVAGGEVEHARFFEDKVSPYAEIIGVLAEQNHFEEAFQYAERARARVLLDVMRSGRVDITRAMNAGEQEQENRLTRDLVALNGQLSAERRKSKPDATRITNLDERLRKARLDRESFETALYASHPELKVQRGEAQPVKVEQAAPMLAETNGAAVEYVVGEHETFMISLTRPSQSSASVETRVYRIEIERQTLTDLVGQFRQRLANHDLGFQELATRLYALLIKPAEQQLKGKSLLVLVPDQVLWSLPFQALMPSEKGYLIEDFAVSYVPSLTVLHEMIKSRSQMKAVVEPSKVLLAVGNPYLGKKTAERARSVLMDESLEPLPEAERQVKELGQLYGGTYSKVYTGAEAREDVVKAECSKYRIMHLATHGVLNDAAPMYSHVVLSQPDANGTEDGLLEAWEIMKLDLKAELVVLSACETARGKIARGEGVIGLTWALFVAGCPSTVVSQWKVESASTTELMLELHRHLKSMDRKPSDITRDEGTIAVKAESLRRAALKLLKSKRYSHPFYWAGFVVVGSPF